MLKANVGGQAPKDTYIKQFLRGGPDDKSKGLFSAALSAPAKDAKKAVAKKQQAAHHHYQHQKLANYEKLKKKLNY